MLLNSTRQFCPKYLHSVYNSCVISIAIYMPRINLRRLFFVIVVIIIIIIININIIIIIHNINFIIVFIIIINNYKL